MLNRRQFLATASVLGGAIAAPSIARAQNKRFAGVVLNINGYGGDFDRIMTETIAKPLEEETGLKVVYTPGSSAAAVAKIIAAPGNAPFDAVLCDSPSMPDLVKAGAIEPLTAKDVPNVSKFLPGVREFGDHGMPFIIGSMVIACNTKLVKTLVSSYADLGRPDLKGRVGLFNLENTGGLLQFLAMTEAAGGSVDNVDPGFKALAKLKPNVTSITPSTVGMVQLLEQEEAWVAGCWDSRTFAMRKAGKPIATVAPTEGIYSLLSYVSPVKGTKNPEAVKAYLQKALSDESIGALATFFGVGPTTNVKLAPDVVKEIATYGEEKLAKIKKVDWVKVAARRGEWLTRFNQEMR